MIPIGYMAKRIPQKPEWLKAPTVTNVYSVSGCVNDDFGDYGDDWKRNGWGFFDSPDCIQKLSREHSIELQDMQLFYYEAFELQFDEDEWRAFSPSDASYSDTDGIIAPSYKRLDGYDVVTVLYAHGPECSPLSCNSLAEVVPTNSHCLFNTLEEAQTGLNSGQFAECEPGALRIFAVFSVDWPPPSSVAIRITLPLRSR
jgi:hypothetical protein